MAQRIYRIDDADTKAKHLVVASSRPWAIAHVARSKLTASVPSGIEVSDLINAGVKVEHAANCAQAEIEEPAE